MARFFTKWQKLFFLAKKSGCFVNLFELCKKSFFLFFYFCMFVLTFLKRSNMKKIILASMIACAAALTACGDDDSGTSASGSKASCDLYMGGSGDISGHLCFEVANSQVADQLCAAQGTAYSAAGGSATVGSGCPSGAKLECPQKDGGKIYIYGVMAYGESCDTFSMD